jgi:hypothetical protein
MNQSIPISSPLILTILMMIGLFFFIRASVKDRTEKATYRINLSEEALLPKLQEYFDNRSYQVKALDPQQNQVTFEGYIAPSLFMAIFLSFLAGLGFFCLGLVISYLYPSVGYFIYFLPLLSPLAGVFYWSKAGKLETVKLSIETTTLNQEVYSIITVIAHRDELISLNEKLSLEMID